MEAVPKTAIESLGSGGANLTSIARLVARDSELFESSEAAKLAGRDSSSEADSEEDSDMRWCSGPRTALPKGEALATGWENDWGVAAGEAPTVLLVSSWMD